MPNSISRSPRRWKRHCCAAHRFTLCFETEVTRTRPYWFDERVNSPQSVRRLTFAALTNSYRVDTGRSVAGTNSYATLDEALRQIRLVRGRSLLDKRELRSGERYEGVTAPAP